MTRNIGQELLTCSGYAAEIRQRHALPLKHIWNQARALKIQNMGCPQWSDTSEQHDSLVRSNQEGTCPRRFFGTSKRVSCTTTDRTLYSLRKRRSNYSLISHSATFD